jgi:glycosyltransferase involved in cell wall biosynthesis
VPRVAFVTPGVLPMLRQRDGTVYGGSELRAWRFARGLADIGFDVSIVGFDGEPIPADLLGPVSIVAPPTTKAWLTSLRRMLRTDGAAQSAPWRAADADVYIAFGVAEYNAALAEWCKANNRPLLLFAGSDADFSVDYRPGNTGGNIWGSRCDRCYDSIKGATTIVVQTETQKRMAKERFGRDAEVVANPVVMTSSPPDGMIGERFLWIGKAVANKRPELALTIAEACPDQSFVMILNDVGNGMFDEISRAKPPNVQIVASVPPSQLEQYFLQARALLCTSDFEGFPNTFLDAGRFGVPIISLSVDPDGVVARERGGFIADRDIYRAIGAVRRFADEPGAALAAGRRLYRYVKREHEASGRVDQLAGVVRRIVAGRSEEQDHA